MTVCRIERRLEDPAATVARAKEHSVKWGSVFTGDAERGEYVIRTPLGSLEGTYAVRDSVVTFVIEKKSRLIPVGLIEKVLDEFLGPTGRRP